MDRWKEYLEDLFNIENERELMRDEGEIIDQDEDIMHNDLITKHYNITTEMLQNLGEK